MSKFSLVVFLIAASATVSFAEEGRKHHQPKITPQTSGTTQLLIDVSPVNSRVVWAAGTGGTYVVTTDGGEQKAQKKAHKTSDKPKSAITSKRVRR